MSSCCNFKGSLLHEVFFFPISNVYFCCVWYLCNTSEVFQHFEFGLYSKFPEIIYILVYTVYVEHVTIVAYKPQFLFQFTLFTRVPGSKSRF